MKALSALVSILVVLTGSTVGAQNGRAAAPSLLKATFGELPIYFVENRGVCPDEVAYYVQGADKTLFFTKEGITFRLKGKGRDWVVKLEFVGANPDVVPQGENRQQAVFSYFRGPQTDWKTGLGTCSKVVYRDLWPGVDLIYKGTINQLKYEFQVAPGADPGRIRLRYRGVTSLTTTDSDALRVQTPEGSFEDAPPEAWQHIDGRRLPVEMRYRLDPELDGDNATFGFAVGDYDRATLLVLDPAVIVYCGFLGGVSYDRILGIAVDSSGRAYVAGWTDNTAATFPVKVGPALTHRGGTWDAFVARVNAAGTGLDYCGYIGGADQDLAYGVAVDSGGRACVVGWTESTEYTFPVRVGPYLIHNGATMDAFVACVNAAGTGLDYCGYIGGRGDDYGQDVAVDAQGNAYVLGQTNSDEKSFPVRVGPDLTFNGTFDYFVAKVNPAGTRLDYCGYIGGAGSEGPGSGGIAVDAQGQAYVTGTTSSDETTFPVRVGPDLTYNGWFLDVDAFVAKVNAQGTALVYCGYIGGARQDQGQAIAIDAQGAAYVAGSTMSPAATFPVKVGPDLTLDAHTGGFVAKVNAAGTALDFCGYVGGASGDYCEDIAVDTTGRVCLAGTTWSDEASFPVPKGPQVKYRGLGDAFVAWVDPSGDRFVSAAFLGGADQDTGNAVALDASGNAYVAGWSQSHHLSFPVRRGPFLTSYCAPGDGFVAKVAVALLDLSGTPLPGSRIDITATATDDAGLTYQLGSSLGSGPIPIDTRQINLSRDALLMLSVGGWWPSVFSGYRGTIDAKGQARGTIYIPNLPVLVGTEIHTAFVTLDPWAPSGIRTISDTEAFTIL